MKVVIVGSGYVGLTTGAALAYIGHQVTLLDIDQAKIAQLRNGQLPIHERGLKEIISREGNAIAFESGWEEIDLDVDVIVIAVGTPTKTNGDADLTYVEAVAHLIGEHLNVESHAIVVNKSTVPLGSARRVKSVIELELKRRGVNKEVDVASNPEFLREGEALFDTFYPDRIVIGVNTEFARNALHTLYQPILDQTFDAPKIIMRPEGYTLPTFVTTNPTSAELIKYAANSFLAMKISFINEFGNLAERVGADIVEVAKGIGLDKRIGSRFLNAGAGWGGSCFGKDTAAIYYTAEQYNCEMLLVRATVEANIRQRMRVVEKLKNQLKVIRGSTIGVLGLAFKPNTDDLRDAPALDVIRELIELGAHVKVYDPIAMQNFSQRFDDLRVETVLFPEKVFEDSDAVVLLTEWVEFRDLPYKELAIRMKEPNLIDGRNMLNPRQMRQAGFSYCSIGRE